MNAIILSGGKCSRISVTKPFIKIGQNTIIESTIQVLNNMFNDIIIVTNDLEKYSHLHVKTCINDIIPGKGPLGGIYAGLSCSDSFQNFIIACDMPFVEPDIITLLLNYADKYDIVIPEYNGFIEPLYAVYSKNCIKVISEHIKHNDLKVKNIFPKLNVKFVDCNNYPMAQNAFFNINTPRDLHKAQTFSKMI